MSLHKIFSAIGLTCSFITFCGLIILAAGHNREEFHAVVYNDLTIEYLWILMLTIAISGLPLSLIVLGSQESDLFDSGHTLCSILLLGFCLAAFSGSCYLVYWVLTSPVAVVVG